MRMRSILGALMVCLLIAIPAMAQDLSLEERVKAPGAATEGKR